MKSVVQARNAFAAVHSAYAMSLRDTGAALFEFAHGEGVLPPPPPPPTTTGPRGRRRAPTRSCSNGGDLIRGSRSLSVSEGSSDGCLLHGDVPQQALVLLAAARPQRVSIPASSLLSRLYYNNGGQSKWILSWSAVAG
ncbi:Os08g0342700 [Oryza sativa Japonica Group]|uniref:Os08g0342700 protein n=1 Tax=Oryza sativa subsp. japonica TaxID=39947 RepID=A0A0N7KPP7_ORYSJ|nr:Os08g0342700 [Oryza sativa Japonica Group]